MQAGRGGLQQRITGGMAEAVVDVLEAVQVDEQHGQRGAAIARLLDGLRRLFTQQYPVGQAGQQIVVRQQLDAFVGFTLAGDVTEQDHEAWRQAIATIQFDQHLYPHAQAGLAVEAQIQLLGQSTAGDPPQRRLKRRTRILGIQCEGLVEGDRLLAQAVDAIALLGPLHVARGNFNLAAANASERGYAVEQFGAPADEGVGLVLFGDVLHLPQQAPGLAVHVQQRLHPQPQVLGGLVAAGQFQFDVGGPAITPQAPPGCTQCAA
ncbi:hypothetical protein D3C71_1072860 [compost metagenome]